MERSCCWAGCCTMFSTNQACSSMQSCTPCKTDRPLTLHLPCLHMHQLEMQHMQML